MATILVDITHTNDGDGDGWADQTGAGGARDNIPALVANDIVFYRNAVAASNESNGVVRGPYTVASLDNAPRIYGVKAATTATSPATSDLIPGIRTGDATRAYDQTGANLAPVIQRAAAITLEGNLWIYGVHIEQVNATGVLRFENANSAGADITLIECHTDYNSSLAAGSGTIVMGNNTLTAGALNFRSERCKWSAGRAALEPMFLGGFGYIKAEFISDEFEKFEQLVNLTDWRTQWIGKFITCDFTAKAHTTDAMLEITNGRACIEFWNCKMPASTSLTDGLGAAPGGSYLAAYGTKVAGTKTTGESFQDIEIDTPEGTVDDEPTQVRTGGADDGADGSFSYALTAKTGKTREETKGVVSPWLTTWVEGTGVARTLEVYVNNDTGADLNDDDVGIEVFVGDDAGQPLYDYIHEIMDLLGTPSASNTIVDDTGSTWNTTENPQKFTVPIAPDYEGYLLARVTFYKAGTDILYVDPDPVVTVD